MFNLLDTMEELKEMMETKATMKNLKLLFDYGNDEGDLQSTRIPKEVIGDKDRFM